MSARWRENRPPESAWKAPKGQSKADSQREQDLAAGGRMGRVKTLVDGRAVSASVCLRVQPTGRRIYAYLRWFEDRRTRERYVGEVEESTRVENLAAAWRLVGERRLLDQADAFRPARVLRPAPVSENTRTIMRANKSKDTKPERLLRSAVHARGLRYRIHHRPVTDLRRTADLVFTRAKVAVFVDGCFWHGCPEHYRPAQRNSEFWNTKIETNMRRDSDTRQKLEDAGWLVIRVWEHEPVEAAADLILERVAARRTAAESARADESRQSP